MPSAAYRDRIGGLAVALGLGAAIISGWSGGLAWADDSPGSARSPASSNAHGAEVATAKPSASDNKADSSDATTATSTATTGTNGSIPKDGAVRSAHPGVVVDTGGLGQDASASTTKSPHPSETAALPATGTVKPTTTRTAAPVSAVADAKHDEKKTVPATTHVESTHAVGAASPRVAVTPLSSIATPPRTASPPLSSAATPPLSAPSPPNVIGVVSQFVSGFVNAILSPFAALNTPGAPAETPSIWALLAFARREFESVGQFLAGTPVAHQTTGQTPPADTAGQPEQRTLILSALPAEADAVLARTTLDPNPTVVVDGHHFYLGTLGGKKVIVAMTGIGEVNATQTTETAVDHFTPASGISIDAVVFSGVAGGSGRTEIGDVAVPARWTSDGGTTWHAVDPGMLAAANAVTVNLMSTDTIGDPACAWCPLAHIPLINLYREPQLFVGGDGSTSDNNNGTAFPEIPLGGAIFGPQPLAAPDFSLLYPGNFFQAVGPFLVQGLLSNITGLFATAHPAVDAVDQETAAAQQVADAHGIPFLGVRGMSDGPGDPLNLPGYPFTFLVYKQIAADNAAIVTQAFLQSWSPDMATV
jgi:nucleoside phosphorylase